MPIHEASATCRWPVVLLGILLFGLAGCAHRERLSLPRAFAFEHDTLSFANELVWVYSFNDTTGKVRREKRLPPPTYSHRCFVVARMARQFFQFALFEPDQPRADPAVYREAVRRILSIDPAHDLAWHERIVIPGYPNLRAFSREHEALLKELGGGAWQSYFQRGHWRVPLPFTRQHQEATARYLVEELEDNRPPILHLICFPSLAINHAVVAFAHEKRGQTNLFEVYDPNTPEHPVPLTFDQESRTFALPRNDYFRGGEVDVYPVYENWLY